MAVVMEVLGYVVFAVKLVSVAVLLVGLVLCLKNLLVLVANRKTIKHSDVQIQQVKNKLGRYVLLGLEILIIGDIIESIVNPSLEDIARLGAIVVIRTVISYFLNKEIAETESSISKIERSEE